jgi:16S rRNA U516 pseudouridylate synthase RsuA-like enzyme
MGYETHSISEFEITIHEGKKRQIRLMLEAVGHRVVALKRLAQGPLRLGDLKTGAWRIVRNSEIEELN